MKPFLLICIYISVFFIVTGTSCKKQKDPAPDNPFGLPNATQTGRIVFACRINGSNSAYTNSVRDRLVTSFLTNNSRDTLTISAYTSSRVNTTLNSFYIEILDSVHTGKSYNLKDTTKITVHIIRYFAPCGPIPGNAGSQWLKAAEGNITFTKLTGIYKVPSCCSYGSYDPDAILSGTFDFVFVVPNCDTVRVTDGRFDINYSHY